MIFEPTLTSYRDVLAMAKSPSRVDSSSILGGDMMQANSSIIEHSRMRIMSVEDILGTYAFGHPAWPHSSSSQYRIENPPSDHVPHSRCPSIVGMRSEHRLGPFSRTTSSSSGANMPPSCHLHKQPMRRITFVPVDAFPITRSVGLRHGVQACLASECFGE